MYQMSIADMFFNGHFGVKDISFWKWSSGFENRHFSVKKKKKCLKIGKVPIGIWKEIREIGNQMEPAKKLQTVYIIKVALRLDHGICRNLKM